LFAFELVRIWELWHKNVAARPNGGGRPITQINGVSVTVSDSRFLFNIFSFLCELLITLRSSKALNSNALHHKNGVACCYCHCYVISQWKLPLEIPSDCTWGAIRQFDK
jgi:hypothetical protein